MNAKNEAIATADAHLSNVGLPTYTQMEAALTRAAHMLTAVFEIANTLAEHPDANKGNSKVHYCRMRAIGALEKLNGDDVADLKALALKPTYQELADCVAELLACIHSDDDGERFVDTDGQKVIDAAEALVLPWRAAQATNHGAKTREHHNGFVGYVNIETDKQSLDVRIEQGKTPAESLAATAADWRRQAARLLRNAELVEAVAADLERNDAKNTGRLQRDEIDRAHRVEVAEGMHK